MFLALLGLATSSCSDDLVGSLASFCKYIWVKELITTFEVLSTANIVYSLCVFDIMEHFTSRSPAVICYLP